MIAIVFPEVATLVWTNPPEQDLAELRFYATRFGSADTLTLPSYYGRKADHPDSSFHIYPGKEDSIWVTVPCMADSTTWKFWCFAVDTAGNVSQPSNIASWHYQP